MKEVTAHIVDFVARDLCPMNVGEGQGFFNLMKCIEPGYKSQSHFRASEKEICNSKESFQGDIEQS